MKLRTLPLLCACSVMSLALICPAFAVQKVTMSILPGNGDPAVVAAQKDFKEFIETKSNGRYEVEVYFGATMGNCDTVFQGVQFGTIQIALDSVSNLSQFAPELAIMDMPFLMPGEEQVRRITEGPVGDHIMSYLGKKGVHPVQLNLVTPRAIVSTTPLTKPDDIHGQKMRSTTSRTHMAAIKGLGFAPPPLPPSEILTGLQQGVIVATDTEYPGIYNWRFCDVAKHILLSDYIPVIWFVYASQDWYNSLPAEDRALFDEGFKIYQQAFRGYIDEAVEQTFKTIQEEYGCTITRLTDEEKAVFAERSRGAYDILTPAQMKLVEMIRAELSK